MSTNDPKLLQAERWTLELAGYSVAKAIEYLEGCAEGWDKSEIEMERDWDGDREYVMVNYRYETPKEVAKRVASVARVREASRKSRATKKAQQEADERATFLRLKAKFGE